ncbi:Na+/H+ antiporter NhaA [Pontivivens insulae]|uniref:Na(+)/H(+) antiporter NhaA n=1 Tax=Pontivivens insulae TaxID=1639689 RepID=A0A2R8A779_9RHOB|nr:Na+/H+ antiporter NhaA [Pontivivens insulae]RED17981.1 sodium/proton antiporter (NhaA family) [Pontivivens insulae]SPF27870.1 Na(+)/H(+) antiporter NhaA [Pontivivens insulae]
MYRVWNILSEYSLLLIIGALTALVWANVDFSSYHHFVEYVIWDHAPIGHYHDGHRTLTFHYLVNDVLMALFFAIAGKEVWEAIALKDGSLRGKKAMTPLIATSGGMLGPIAVYLGLAFILGKDTYDAVANGWAIPTATDIAFSYLIGRLIFGAGHPAVGFLLLLAIADDAIGLIILAIFYPTGELAPIWLLLSFGAALGVFVLFNWLPRRLDRGKQDRPNSTAVRKALGGLPYIIAGCLSWYGFMRAGVHPALGLLPIVPTIPHADRAFGIFAEAEKHLHDLLNTMEHAIKGPVEVVLLLFGLANAGVVLGSVGDATWLVLAGLLIGKPFGILLMGVIAAKGLRLGLPDGMKTSDLFVLGCVAAIGFTVSLFIATVAFPAGSAAEQLVQDAAKLGALLSFAAAIMAFVSAKIFRTEKME